MKKALTALAQAAYSRLRKYCTCRWNTSSKGYHMNADCGAQRTTLHLCNMWRIISLARMASSSPRHSCKSQTQSFGGRSSILSSNSLTPKISESSSPGNLGGPEPADGAPLGAREQLAYVEAISTVKKGRYAST